MKLLIVLITYERLEYTKRTLRDLWDTIDVPYYLVVVDNASTDGTAEYLRRHKKRNKIDMVILNKDNYYPGKACNIGWYEGSKRYPQATHFMRLDNDMHLEKGWDHKASEYFDKIPDLGQLGLDYTAIEGPEAQGKKLTLNGMTINHWPGCVGGPCIIRREIWDAGIMYDETPWQRGPDGSVIPQEDSKLSFQVMVKGWVMGHWTDKLAWTFANETNWHEYKDYYKKTMYDRGYDDNVKKLEQM